MIARKAVTPLKAHARAWPEHEHPTLLDRVTLAGSLAKAGAERLDALQDGERVESAGPTMRKPRSVETRERRVGEEKAPIARRIAESSQVFGAPAPDHRHVAAPLANLGLCRDEASDLLAAEDSTEVPNEDEHQGDPLPERAEADGRAKLVEHRERREPCCQTVIHVLHGTQGGGRMLASSSSAREGARPSRHAIHNARQRC
jgi:hypothetical protein